MADVDITSLSVEISAESHGAELNIDKLATAISNLRTKGNVAKVCSSLDRLSSSISALKSASTGIDGLSKITSFMNGLANVRGRAILLLQAVPRCRSLLHLHWHDLRSVLARRCLAGKGLP